jgi:hypothetical protein
MVCVRLDVSGTETADTPCSEHLHACFNDTSKEEDEEYEAEEEDHSGHQAHAKDQDDLDEDEKDSQGADSDTIR